MRVFLDPDRVSVGADRLRAVGDDKITIGELLSDPGKTARVWNELRWILTGEREFRDERDRRLGDLVDGIMR